MKKITSGLRLTGIALALAVLAPAHAEKQEERVAKIMDITGSAVVERNTHRYTALPGMILVEGDIIRALEGGNVDLKYDTCQSKVKATMEVTISKSSQCPAGTVAKAEDLTAPSMPASKIQRIDPNMVDTACSTCKVKLASGVPFAVTSNAVRGAAAVLGIAGLSSGSDKKVSPP